MKRLEVTAARHVTSSVSGSQLRAGADAFITGHRCWSPVRTTQREATSTGKTERFPVAGTSFGFLPDRDLDAAEEQWGSVVGLLAGTS